MAAATKELGVAYPVVQDNDFAIWKRYATWAWPAAVIVDKKGVVRYTHIGEGAYAETEQLIRRLLAEPLRRARAAPLLIFARASSLAAAILAVLGYLSLRQWEASAERAFREQARDMADMAAEKVEMALRKGRGGSLRRTPDSPCSTPDLAPDANRGLEAPARRSSTASIVLRPRAGSCSTRSRAARRGGRSLSPRCVAEIAPGLLGPGGRRHVRRRASQVVAGCR